MHRRSRPMLIVAALLAASSVALVFALLAARPRHTEAAGSVPTTGRSPLEARAAAPLAGPAAGLLDGVPLSDAERRARANDLPVAVMIDNAVAARPQIGLDRAEIVYEALVEYGITRFMGVYWRNDADVIEPVRSARTQYLGTALELGAT